MSTPFLRDVAWRFVAGEDLDAGLAAVRALNALGITATLSHVGTHVEAEAEAVAAADEAIAAIRGVAAAGVQSHLSLKLTQIGLDIGPELARTQLRRVLDAAAETGIFVWLDMEESRYVAITLEIFDEVCATHGPERVGIVLQSYLRHHREDVARLATSGARVRLVKGGYWESPGLVFHEAKEVDAAFLADIETLVRHGSLPAIATHDPRAIETTCRLASEAGRSPADFELQMLYGVRPDLQARLVKEGFAVRCYVPYGGQWYAYVLGCVRRVPGGLVRRGRDALLARGATTRGRPPGRARLALKRAMDIAAAILGMVVLSPVLAWTALAVMVSMGTPILFRQGRPGRDGRIFTILKFRTMRPAVSGEAWYATDADRVTRVGRFLRATSLDELPELWNVLRGDMSLVGPRPLLVEYLPSYTEREQRRHAMRPGITGWAVVSGRHTLPFEARLELDAWYVDHWSLGLDLRILARTVIQVLGGDGVRATQDFAEIEFPARFEARLASGEAPSAPGAGGAPLTSEPRDPSAQA